MYCYYSLSGNDDVIVVVVKCIQPAGYGTGTSTGVGTGTGTCTGTSSNAGWV